MDELIYQISSGELFKKYFTKEYLKEIDEKLKIFSKEIRVRQHDKNDVVIGVTGYPGVGKTTLVIYLCWLINNEYIFEKNVCFIPTAKQIEKKYFEIKPYGVFHIDEASKAMHKYKWWDASQQTLNTIYDTERAEHYKASILIMPRFQNFTENFRNFRIQYWINIIARGIAIVYRKDEDKDAKDPWHLEESYKKKQKKWHSEKKRVFERSIADIIKIESMTENYWFWFRFPILPKEIEDLFFEMRNKAKLVTPEEKPKTGRMMQKHLHRIYLGWLYAKRLKPDLTMSEYARETRISLEGLRREIQVQESNSSLNI